MKESKNVFYMKIAAVMGYYMTTIQRGLKTTIDLKEFYSVITSDDLVNKRDYFYSCFYNETTADKWWEKLIDERLDKELEGDYEKDIYLHTEDIERTFKEAFS